MDLFWFVVNNVNLHVNFAKLLNIKSKLTENQFPNFILPLTISQCMLVFRLIHLD